MQKSVNLRKRRLLEAFEEIDQNEKKILSVGSTTTNPSSIPAVRSKDGDFEKLLKKVKMLEQWEDSKRAALEKLSLDIDTLQEAEELIEAKQKALVAKGLSLDCIELEQYKTLKNDKKLMLKSFDKLSANSTPKYTDQIKSEPTSPISSGEEDGMIAIGPNGTIVRKRILNGINWESPAVATRKLLMEVFDRKTLAFHTLTGKPSPAFIECDKPVKMPLDSIKVADIIHIVTSKSNVTPKDVRSAITTKCADENKMYRQREGKRKSIQANKENVRC